MPLDGDDILSEGPIPVDDGSDIDFIRKGSIHHEGSRGKIRQDIFDFLIDVSRLIFFLCFTHPGKCFFHHLANRYFIGGRWICLLHAQYR